MNVEMKNENKSKVNIFLVRHGESVGNIQRIVCGQLDSPLSEVGIKQAKALKRTINKEGLFFNRVYSSPLSRALKTANIITQNPEQIIVNELLKEIDAGDYSTMSIIERDRTAPRLKDHGRHPEESYPNGESYNELRNRVITFVKILKKSLKEDENILIVAHWGTLNLIIQELFNIPHRFTEPFYLLNCTLNYISLKPFDNDIHPQLNLFNYI